MAGQKTSALLYRRWCSQAYPGPQPARTQADPGSRPCPCPCRSLTAPGLLACTRPTAPDLAQPISSRARSNQEARPRAGERLGILRSPSLLEPRESFLGDAVTNPPHLPTPGLPLSQGGTQKPRVWALARRCLGGHGPDLTRQS